MLLAPLVLLLPAPLQDPAAQAPATRAQPAEPPPKWVTTLSAYWIEPPYQSGYASAILTADKGPLHLEAHWAYEDRDTLSLFAGKSFPVAGDISGTVTPRLGVAGGDSSGLIPAINLALGWKKLSFYTDFEYMIGLSSDTSDFLYSWTELQWAFTPRFSAGIVGQRTHTYAQDLEVDRGLMFSWALGRVRATGYFFNLDESHPYFTLAVGSGF
jgi:hypothetical protein